MHIRQLYTSTHTKMMDATIDTMYDQKIEQLREKARKARKSEAAREAERLFEEGWRAYRGRSDAQMASYTHKLAEVNTWAHAHEQNLTPEFFTSFPVTEFKKLRDRKVRKYLHDLTEHFNPTRSEDVLEG